MSTIPTYIVDAFTDQPFKGNQAGVCLLETPLPPSDMLAIAAELGYSETAFILPNENAKQSYDIRYFSPQIEIPLCGHATLASSKVIFEKFRDQDTLTFNTGHGVVIDVVQSGESIQMELPRYELESIQIEKGLLPALGISEIIYSGYNTETNIIMLEIGSAEILRNLSPDFEALVNCHTSIHGVSVTAKSETSNIDFESRFFWPWAGTQEDPVTGGTHTFLTPYWANRLQKDSMRSFQCSKRTGWMDVTLSDQNTVLIKSQASIVFRGELII